MSDNRDRPRDLPAVALTIGSSTSEDACPHRWWLRRGEGLRPIHRDLAPRYGDAWHLVLEDVHLWWRDRGRPYQLQFGTACAWCEGRGRAPDPSEPLLRTVPCGKCGGSGLGPVMRQAMAWTGTDQEGDEVKLQRALEGWLLTYGAQLSDGWSVVGVEVPLSFPIPSPFSSTGQTYRPELAVVTRPDGTRRLARTGEALPGRLPASWRVDWERVPAHASIRLDALLRGPGGAAYVGEWKSSAEPGQYLAGLPVDPQVTIYELALEHACATGALWLPGPGRIGWPGPEAPTASGWAYDVTSSRLQRDLHTLKGGGFSVAKGKLGSVPSWRMVAGLALAGVPWSAEAGKDELGRVQTWGDRIAWAAARVDGKLYKREYGASPDDLRQRVLLEMFATARRRADWHRAAALAGGPREVALAFPRITVCRASGGRCPYRGPCESDGPEARRWFEAPDDVEAPPVEDWPEPEDVGGEPD